MNTQFKITDDMVEAMLDAFVANAAKILKRRSRGQHTPPPGSKLETISKLLHRKNGCTRLEVMEATGWPSVSMPAQARALGIKLRIEKQYGVTRYWAA